MLGILTRRFRTSSLLRNSIFILAATVFTSALGYFYWVYAAHAYSAASVGLSGALISAMTLTSNLCNLGVGATLVQQLPRRTPGHDWSLSVNSALLSAVVTSFVGGLATLAIFTCLSQFASLWTQPDLWLGYAVGVPLWTILDVVSSVFVAERVARYMLAVQTLFALSKLLLLLIVGFNIFSAWVVALPNALALAILLILRLRKDYRLTLTGFRTQVRRMLGFSLKNHLINVGAAAPAYLLPVLVTAQLSPAENAYFYIAWMLRGIFSMVSVAVSSALLAEGSHDEESLGRQTRNAGLIVAFMVLPGVLILLVGGQANLKLFGPGYASHSATVWTLLILSAMPDAVTNIYSSVLRVQGRMSSAVQLNLGISMVVLVLAYLLIPVIGSAGAACAWLLGQCCGCGFVAVDMLLLRRSRRLPGLPTSSMMKIQSPEKHR